MTAMRATVSHCCIASVILRAQSRARWLHCCCCCCFAVPPVIASCCGVVRCVPLVVGGRVYETTLMLARRWLLLSSAQEGCAGPIRAADALERREERNATARGRGKLAGHSGRELCGGNSDEVERVESSASRGGCELR